MLTASRFLLGYVFWTLGTGAILSATIFNMMAGYQFGIGGRATAWPVGVLIAGLVGLLTFPACVMLLRTLSRGSPDCAHSISASRVGMVGFVLLLIGAGFTLLAYFSRFDETLVVMFSISVLYPLAAWRMLRDNPMPADSSDAVRRGAIILGVVWMIIAIGLIVFWLSGILTEWSYFSGSWLMRLMVGVMLLHVLSSVAMHLVGRFIRKLRPLAVSFGWVLGASVVTFVPVVTVYLGLVGLVIFSYIE